MLRLKLAIGLFFLALMNPVDMSEVFRLWKNPDKRFGPGWDVDDLYEEKEE